MNHRKDSAGANPTLWLGFLLSGSPDGFSIRAQFVFHLWLKDHQVIPMHDFFAGELVVGDLNRMKA